MSSPATFETFQLELSRLVDRFEREHPHFTSPDYNEAMVRADFLDPFFRALGWDVGNAKGLIFTEREVDIEVRTALSGRQTRADYVFRVSRIERFTCEAKKPAEVLHDRHIYQAKRDAFARGIPLAVLTDFEDLKIFVVGARPHRSEAKVGEYKAYNFRQYPSVARELWDLLAYERVSSGSIDALIDSLPKRAVKVRGRQGYLIKPDRTRSLDADFLAFLDEARRSLGSDLLKNNDRDDLLEGNRLNEATQRILDRLVFLRICEDRGIDTGQLLQSLFEGWYRQQKNPPKLTRATGQGRLGLSSSGGGAVEEEPAAYGARRPAPPTEGGLYREIVDHLRSLDQRPPSYKPFFNGQLFKPHFSEDLLVGDEWLANFIDDLTDDDTGYNFADIKVEILGAAYEHFLGKVLRPQGRGVAIEEKPEVRKAGGVYYTPRYIVDYIVEQTVGRLLEGKTPREVAKLRFLDPACGSGSFLIRVYERVMEHYLRYFTAQLADARHGLDEKSDEAKAAVAKTLTRLKADCYLDPANNVRLTTRLKRRILQENIYGVDIDAQAVEVSQLSLYLKMLEGENRETLRAQSTDLFEKEALLPPLDKNILCGNSLIASDFSLDPAELVRVNAFDWDVGFEKIMASGGFDAVVGNPPYGMVSDESNQSYFKTRFSTVEGRFDLFELFIERAIQLSKPINGALSFIVPSPVLTNVYSRKLRQHLLATGNISEITNFGIPVFDDPTVHTCIFRHERGPRENAITSVRMKVASVSELRGDYDYTIPQSELGQSANASWDIFIRPETTAFLSRLTSTAVPLSTVCHIRQCIKTGNDEIYVLNSSTPLKAPWKLSLRGRSIDRYETKEKDIYLKYGDWLARNWQNKSFYETPKIAVRETGARITATIDLEERFFLSSLYAVYPKDTGQAPSLKFLLGLINSTFATWYVRLIAFEMTEGAFTKIRTNQFGRLPIPARPDKQHHNSLVALVDKMLTLTPALRTAKNDAERTALQNALTKTDRDIDQLVYQLYGLTPEEIALVEGSGNPAPALEAD